MIFVYGEHEKIVTIRIPISHSVTGDNYKIFLAKKLQTGICKRRLEIFKYGMSILYCNARPHARAPVIVFLEKY